jgi:hypothetical protein
MFVTLLTLFEVQMQWLLARATEHCLYLPNIFVILTELQFYSASKASTVCRTVKFVRMEMHTALLLVKSVS